MPWRGSWTTTSARGRGWRPDRSRAGGREGEGARGWNPTENGTRGMAVGGPGGARAAEDRGVEEGREGSWEEREVKEAMWEAGEADREV